MLDSACHLHHIAHDLLYRGIGHFHVDASNGDHEVETGDDVSCVLNQLVEIGQVVSPALMGLLEVSGDVAKGVKDGHIYNSQTNQKKNIAK